MTIEYKDSKRIVGLSSDMSSNIVTINHRCSTTDDHAYADLGSALSNTSWVMRYKMVISGYSASSTNPNNAYLFAISQTTANNMSDQSLGLKMRIGGGSGYSDFFVGGGTSSQNNAEGYEGSLFSSQTTANGTWYVEYIRNGSSFSIRLTTSSDYTGGELDTWATSGTVEDLRYIKYTNRDDNTSSHVLVATISDIKIYDGVTSATGTFVRDGTWTASSSNKVTVATQDIKPTDIQDNSILVEKDTARRYWFTGESSETLSQETESGNGELFNDVEIVAQKFTSGSSKIGKKVSSVAFYLKRNTSTIGSTNLQCFVGAGNQSSAVAYGTLPATSLTTSYAWYTFTPSVAGTERTLVADDRIMIRWADGSTTSDAPRMASDQSGNNPLANETGQYSADDGSNFTDRSFDYMYKIISTTPATWTMEPTYGTNFASSSGWTENTTTASDIDIQTASNRVYLNLTHNSSETSVLSRTLPTTSDTAWILRFKVNATSVGTDGSLLVGLSTNASASDTQQRFLGFWFKELNSSALRAVTDKNNMAGGLAAGNNTTGYTGTPSSGTDYYVTVVRDVNDIKVTTRTGSHTGTAVGSGTVTTAVDGTATGLNTLKIMNHKSSTGGAWIGYLYDLEFYNGVTSIN